MSETITILGASARAAAWSAVRAGFVPVAGDLFADADLARLCQAQKVERYPHGLAEVCAGPQPGDWMYTGALENYPELIARLSALRPLMGNSAEVVRRVRDPWQLAAVVREAKLPFPDIVCNGSVLRRDGTWLCKAIRSAGGGQVTPWTVDHPGPAMRPGWYFQRYFPGTPVSAVFVAARGEAVFIGATEQLIGEAWTGASGFRYCGSLGPLTLRPSVRKSLERLGGALASAFGLVGLFGIDGQLDDDVFWPLEVNPRYTASVEVLERGLGLPCVRYHVDACRSGTLPEVPQGIALYCGKAILFARRDETFGDRAAECLVSLAVRDKWPSIADIPRSGTHILAGHPALTVPADGRDRAEVLVQLGELAAAADAALGGVIRPEPAPAEQQE